ncbi:MAG: phosphodiester glycosidase family protein, partial [Terriglobales bacterium]
TGVDAIRTDSSHSALPLSLFTELDHHSRASQLCGMLPHAKSLACALDQDKDVHSLLKSGGLMSRRFVIRGFSLFAILIGLLAIAADSQAARAASPCVPLPYRSVSYIACTVDLRAYLVRLFWKDSQQQPYGGFDRLPRRVADDPIVFAMNAGMYEEDLSPVGLYVEDGKTLRPANLKNGSGNFYLKPNGVLYITGRDAGIITTDRFVSERRHVDFATQSGPMLVINGHTNPRIKSGSTSQKIRNGVGIRDSHTLVFAISEQPVSFWDFAQFFRVGLHSQSALFLDGSISSLYAPALHRSDTLYPMGPIVAAYERK